MANTKEKIQKYCETFGTLGKVTEEM